MPKKRIQEKPGIFYILPLAFVMAVVPLIVFMKVDMLSGAESQAWYQDVNADFFSFYKSQWVVISAVLAVLLFLVHGLVKKFEVKKDFLYIPTFVYAGCIILSAVLSKNKDVAINGFVARYEGMIVLLCYLALFLAAFNLAGSESQLRFLFGALMISGAVISLIGILQLFGRDPFKTEFGKRLILPKEFHQLTDGLTFRFDDNFVSATFSNSNYIGSYAVLFIPIALMLAVCTKKIGLKIGSACLGLLMVVTLFGSRSRAGLVALIAIVVMVVILLLRVLTKRKLLAVLVICGTILAFFGVNAVLSGLLVNRIVAEFTEGTNFYDLQDIDIDGNSVKIAGASESLRIEEDNGYLYFYDTDGSKLEPIMQQNGEKTTIKFAAESYKGYTLELQGDVLSVYQNNITFRLRIKEDGIKFMGLNGQEFDHIDKAEAWGFKGRERLGSARGYIWSRTLPLLRDKLIVGSGPDTFAMEFPQNDYIGKIRAYGMPHMLVDKPHNMYLQMAFNTGILSLIAFLVLVGYYVVQFLLYFKNTPVTFTDFMGIGIFLSIVGYLVAGIFNDSVVAIAPIFWVFLGLGFACNLALKKQSIKERPTKNG